MYKQIGVTLLAFLIGCSVYAQDAKDQRRFLIYATDSSIPRPDAEDRNSDVRLAQKMERMFLAILSTFHDGVYKGAAQCDLRSYYGFIEVNGEDPMQALPTIIDSANANRVVVLSLKAKPVLSLALQYFAITRSEADTVKRPSFKASQEFLDLEFPLDLSPDGPSIKDQVDTSIKGAANKLCDAAKTLDRIDH
ncbi:hypothetical protein WNB94_17160 [Aquabacterium sp. A3]|uniref:hypothetical protein n=1 Tax=Aquabacterium sp. A3 TaxID=3132829 RepID=UPI003119688F